MQQERGRGDSLAKGFPGDGVTKSLGTILAGEAGPKGEAQDGPSNPIARAPARSLVYWAEVACGASAGQPYDRV